MDGVIERCRSVLAFAAIFFAGLFSSAAHAADTPPAGVTLVDLTTPSTTCEWSGSKGPSTFKPFNDSTSLTDTNNRVLVAATSITVICDFGEGNEKTVNAYRLYMFNNGCNNRTPSAWTLSGSNDKETWEEIDSRKDETNWANLESRFFYANNFKKYRYYKQAFTATSGANDYIQFGRLEYFCITDFKVTGPQLVDLGDGSWRVTGQLKDVVGDSVKLVVSSADAEDVELTIDSCTTGSAISFDFTPAEEGLSLTSFNTLKLVVPDGDAGTETPIPGKYSFAGYARNPNEFAKKLTIEPSEAILSQLGDATYADFPVLVRLSSAIEGFDAVASKWNGADLLFVDEEGNDLCFEVETWSPDGTSFVWVKVPTLSAATSLTCYLGSNKPCYKFLEAKDVWSRYVGVWHFAPEEAGGSVVADATGHALDGQTTASFATLDGPFGNAALTASAVLKAPDYEPAHKVGATFTASGWFICPKFPGTSQNWDTFVSKKTGLSWNAESGWYLQMNQSKTKMGCVLTGSEPTATIPDATQNWNYYTLVSGNGTVKVYMNGSTTPSISQSYTVVANDTAYMLGGTNNGEDEYRIRKGAASAAEQAIEYKTMADVNFFAYGSVESMDASAPTIATPEIARNADGSFTVTAEISDNAPKAGSVRCLVGETEFTMTGSGTGTYTAIVSGLADGTYTCVVTAESAGGTVVERTCPTVFYVGDLSLALGQNATESGTVTGWFTVTRCDDGKALPVNFAVDAASTAIPDQTYVALASPVVIPEGETSVRIEVAPKVDAATKEDTIVRVNLAPGLYGIDAQQASADLTVVNLTTEAGWNTWIASAPGKASVDANWSAGHAPLATEKVMFDGRFSTAACEWDDAAAQTVAGWKQAEGYTAMVEFDTEFPEYASATFPCFTITGDCEILTGGWTCRGNYNNYGAANPSNTSKLASKRWCLNVSVGGKMTLASGATIDLTGKGFGHPGNQSSPSYGGYGFLALETMAPYGSLTEPFDPGMGCRSQGDQNGRISGIGGGAVKLVVTGDLELGGAIRAVGTIDNNVVRSGGTGGSIWIDARQISGEGTIDASGCPPSSFTSDQGVAVGSGGRIALYTKEPLALDRARISCNGAAYSGTSNGSKTKIGSAGTIYIKDATRANGRLVLKQAASVASANAVGSVVPLMGDVTLDGIELSGRVVLAVREGEKLTLPNGFASVTSAETAVGACGITLAGGTIDAGAGDQTIAGWMLEPVSGFAFPANASLVNAGGIGLLKRNVAGTGDAPQMPQSVSFTVAGDFAIDATSAVDVGNAIGYVNYETAKKAGWHGGWTTYFDGNGNAADGRTKTYGSVFNPVAVGSSPSRAYLTGGALDMTVGGTLTLLGKITASGPFSDSTSDNVAPSSGGSVKVTAGAIAGTGSIGSCGGAGRRNYAGGGAGGRIAIKLTAAGATIPETITLNAQGRYGYAFHASANKLGSAGTIYVETKSDGEKGGTIIVSNWKDHANADFTSATVIPTTPIVAAQDGDAVADFKKAKLVICNNAIAEVSAEDLRLNAVTVDAGSSLELAGRTLTVAKATLSSAKLKPGTYKASDAGLVGFVTDSSSGATGSLVVTGGGIAIIVR